PNGTPGRACEDVRGRGRPRVPPASACGGACFPGNGAAGGGLVSAGAGETYTAREVAERLRISEAAVYEACRRGELPCLRIGRRIVFPCRRFDAWFNGDPDSGRGGVHSALLSH